MHGFIHRMRAAAASLAVSARLPGSPSGAASAKATTRRSDGSVAVNGTRAADDSMRQSLSHLAEIAELQRLELARLLDQNRRLNGRIDRLLVLQQRDHAWRERLAGTLQRLATASRPSAPPVQDGDSTRIAAAEARYTALRQSVGQLVGQLVDQSGPAAPTRPLPAVGDTPLVPPPPRQ